MIKFYRPEIDGLRAIAVILVILYHCKIFIFEFEPFKGGFIGVDIFFIISGYLISSILINDYSHQGKINILNFIERRVRRIIPALIFFTLITILLISIFFKEYQKFFFLNLDNAMKSIFFSSNHMLSDYFDPGREANLFYHTWSLSIEIQIYLFFAICFFFIIKLKKPYQIIFLFVVLVISGFLTQFGANLKGSAPYIETNFYFFNQPYWAGFFSPIPRIFEFVLGSLCAIITFQSLEKHKNWLSILGFFLIFLTLMYFKDTTFHPGIYTMPLLIGSCLVIINDNRETLIVKLLSNRIINYTGKLSYSAYLYHLPIIFFVNFYLFNLSLFPKIFIIFFLTFLISYFSFNYIEKIFRRKNINTRLFFKIFIFLYFLIVIFVLYFKYIYHYSGNYKQLDLLNDRKLYISSLKTNIEISGENIGFSNNTFSQNKKKILILGNSISEDMFLIFDTNKEYFNEYEFKFFRMHISNFLQENSNEIDRINFFYNSKLFNDADIILLSTNFRKYGRYSRDIDALSDLFKFIKKNNKQLIITSNVPQFGSIFSPVEDVMFKFRLKLNDKEKINKEVYKLINKNEYKKNDLVIKFAKENNILFLNKFEYMCSDNLNLCNSIDDNLNINLKDNLHVTLSGAKYFGEIIFKSNWFKIY